jgi:hypothetical protein
MSDSASSSSSLGWVGIALQVAGAASSYDTAKKAAKARKAAAEFEAQQLEQNAGQSVAAAQRQAFETQRTGAYVESRARALAAASGGSATDPTVVNNIAALAGETAYRKSLDLYQGEERARQLRLSASAARVTGDIGAAASMGQGQAAVIQAGSGIASELARSYRPRSTPLDTGPSLYTRYGYGNPNYDASGGFNPYYRGGTPENPSYG